MFPLDYHLVTFDRRGVTGDRCLAARRTTASEADREASTQSGTKRQMFTTSAGRRRTPSPPLPSALINSILACSSVRIMANSAARFVSFFTRSPPHPNPAQSWRYISILWPRLSSGRARRRTSVRCVQNDDRHIRQAAARLRISWRRMPQENARMVLRLSRQIRPRRGDQAHSRLGYRGQ